MLKSPNHAKAKHPTIQTDVHDPNLLCDTCRAIDLDEAFSRDVDSDLGDFVADLKASAEELKASNCALCRLFGALAPNLSDDHSSCRSETCHLRSFSGTFGSLAITGINMTLLGVDRFEISNTSSREYNIRTIEVRELYEPGHLCRYQADNSDAAVGVRLISADSFDIMFVKRCLDYCQIHHGPKCRVAGKSEMKQLRIINCETLSIVNAPQGCDYVALSYVWGMIDISKPDAGERGKSQPRVQDAPKTVLDSIEVTLQLGLKFLWIDRYCINQLDEHEKYDQIQQMDLIYENAQLTIIAAEGQDPHRGLPGVRGNLRTHHPSLNIGRHCLVSTLPSIRFAVETSKWETRGWTYQEGLLSHRRLIFTRYQIYFACNEMYCAESVDWSLDRLNFQSKNDFNPESDIEPKYAGKVGAFANEQLGRDPWASIKHISEFNRRVLKFPDDALNAMQGIFN